MRYLRLYLAFLKFSLSKAMQFRLDFTFRIFMDLLYNGVNIAFFQILYLQTDLLGGWTLPQVMIFVSGCFVVDALMMTFVNNNFFWISIFINRGDLDYYLLRPVSSLFFLSLRDFAPNSFINLVASLGILGWAVSQYPEPFSFSKVLLYLALLGIGCVLNFFWRLSFTIPVFWIHQVKGLEQLYWSFTHIQERPDGIFRGFIRRLLTTFIPVCLVVSFPARLVLEPWNWQIFAHLIAGTTVFVVGVLYFWKKGLKAYSSASS